MRECSRPTNHSHPLSVSVGTLAKIMAGDCACPFQAWHEVHFGRPRTAEAASPALVAWKINHTRSLFALDRELQRQGPAAIHRERWIKRQLAPSGLWLRGRIDRVVVAPPRLVVYDCKSGAPRAFHTVQVLLHLYLLGQKAEFRALEPFGIVRYDSDEPVSVGGLIDGFEEQLHSFAGILTSETPPGPAPGSDCRFCPVPRASCSARIDFVA